MRKQKAIPVPKPPKAKIPKANVLGPLGRSQQPKSVTRPDSVVDEFAREQDSPLAQSTYVAPKPAK